MQSWRGYTLDGAGVGVWVQSAGANNNITSITHIKTIRAVPKTNCYFNDNREHLWDEGEGGLTSSRRPTSTTWHYAVTMWNC